MPEQLDVPELPFEVVHVWGWWHKLNATRQVSMDLCRITYTEIKSWTELYKLTMSAFELDCLVEIDSVYMSVRSEQTARKQPTQDE